MTTAILQVRTTSARLPGKALLPIAGCPAAVLAALRAANRGGDVLIATSDDSADDVLAERLGDRGLRIFRGPLQDVLKRFCLAAAGLADDAVVVRLTGDNVVPDGQFVDELTAHFCASGVEYLRVGWPSGKLPYGVSAEVFRASALRKADRYANSSYDREHVGPWMARHCKADWYAPALPGGRDYSHLRCTIDDQEDYDRIVSLFKGEVDPVQIGWRDLVEKLALLPGEAAFRIPYCVRSGQVHSELTLGTAQIGMEYGVVNTSGKPSRRQACNLVRCAVAHGVTAIDTARSYGDAEDILADALAGSWRSRVQVITKLDPMGSLSSPSDPASARSLVETSISESLAALKVSMLDVLLLHRWRHHDDWGGTAWSRLCELRNEGKIARLGASVYEPHEAIAALRDPAVQQLQIPVNVLDRRWKLSGIDSALADRPDVVVHSRSAFLQGILLHAPELWPKVSDYQMAAAAQILSNLTEKFERESVADLCLAYVRSLPWITSIVVGCDTQAQLEANMRLFCLRRLSEEQREEVEATLPGAPETLINPSKWNLPYGPAIAKH